MECPRALKSSIRSSNNVEMAVIFDILRSSGILAERDRDSKISEMINY